jgi:hypothetical protein
VAPEGSTGTGARRGSMFSLQWNKWPPFKEKTPQLFKYIHRRACGLGRGRLSQPPSCLPDRLPGPNLILSSTIMRQRYRLKYTPPTLTWWSPNALTSQSDWCAERASLGVRSGECRALHLLGSLVSTWATRFQPFFVLVIFKIRSWELFA